MDATAQVETAFEATFRAKFGLEFRERRQARRGACDHGATVRKRGCFAVQGRVADLTAEGCRIVGAGPFPRGGEVWVRLDGLESLPAQAVWSQSGLTGARFDRPLHPAVVARYLPPESRVALVSSDGLAPAPAEPISTPTEDLAELTNRARKMRGVVEAEMGPLVTVKRPAGKLISTLIKRRGPASAERRC